MAYSLSVTFCTITHFTPNVTGTTGVPTASKVTGAKYSKKASATFTFPVGRTTSRPTWSTQKAFILAEVAKGSGNKSVTFKPEVF